jgi:hypothetical protein
MRISAPARRFAMFFSLGLALTSASSALRRSAVGRSLYALPAISETVVSLSSTRYLMFLFLSVRF